MSTAASVNFDDPSLYLNRELSWLQFNRRVLEEAQDPDVPLLERLKFLAIFSSNLDEFFMVRVGGLMQKVQAQITRSSGADRVTPQDQLIHIAETVRELVAAQSACWENEVQPTLRQNGIFVHLVKDLTADDRRHLQEVFRSQIFPVLTPLAVDPGHPFPHLANKSLNLAVLLRRPNDPETLFAVVQVPGVLPRMVQLPNIRPDANPATAENVAEASTEGRPSTPVTAAIPPTIYALTPLEVAIRLHLAELFPGMEILDSVCFRVTRDSDFELDDEVDDLLRAIEENVKQRRRGHAVRLEIEADARPEVEQFLIAALDLSAEEMYRVSGQLDLTGLFQIHALPGFDQLRDAPHVPMVPRDLSSPTTMWTAMRSKDILLHHPYESFKAVVDFIEAAADDDRVLAIKQTLYRTSSDSPIVKALQRAADRGKQVTAVIELKARLDEERNILWAKELEKSGVHVVFGFIGLKTHCKLALIVRREEEGIRRYVHLGTGNYNPQTARIYTDLGFFTANPDFADDVTLLFNHLTGYAEPPQYRKLVVAPRRMQPFMIEMIEREEANAKAGHPARIFAKINGLLEPKVVQALYRASQAGVKIEILCRGICSMRPGLPGISENVRIISIIDRFLEHSRIFYFENSGDPQVYIGSADWMDRNLSRRVEVVFPVEQADLKARLIDEVIAISLADNVKARELLPDGSYRRIKPADGQPAVRSQQRFMELALEAERRQMGTAANDPTPSSALAPAPKVVKRGNRRTTGK